MNRIDLVPVPHNSNVGDVLPYLEPTITEDCVLYADGEPIGFYLAKMPERMCKLADLADAEFMSANVPKTKMNRTSQIKKQSARPDIIELYKDLPKGVSQMSTQLGSIPPKPMVRRPYPQRSSVHLVKSAQPFVKAMLLLANESEQLIRDIMPEQHKRQLEAMNRVHNKWRFGNLWTSTISNYNISADMHRDTGNIVGACNVIICKKHNSKGGDLYVPDYGAVFGQRDNSVLVYPAWRNLHGVTPIIPTHDGGYRNSHILYPLKAFVNLP